MKSKIAFVMTACGGALAAIGMMGLSSDGQAFVWEFVITAVGWAVAGVGIVLNKLKERETLRKYTL